MDLSGLSSNQKSDLMDQVKQQIALANAQELLTKMTEKCFKKCVNKPGTELDSSEQKCVAMCMDRWATSMFTYPDHCLIEFFVNFRYMDCFNTVSRSYGRRLQRESQMN